MTACYSVIDSWFRGNHKPMKLAYLSILASLAICTLSVTPTIADDRSVKTEQPPQASQAPQELGIEAAKADNRALGNTLLGASVGAAVAIRNANNVALGAAVGGSVTSLLSGIIEISSFKEAVRNAYMLEGEESEAFNALSEVLYFKQKNMPSVGWYLKAVDYLEKQPEPQLGQLFVDTSDYILKGCLMDRRLKIGQLKEMCDKAIGVMRSVGLRTDIKKPDLTEHMPKKVE